MDSNFVKDLLKMIEDNKELVKSNPKLNDSFMELLYKARDKYDDYNNGNDSEYNDEDDEYAGHGMSEYDNPDSGEDSTGSDWIAQEEAKRKKGRDDEQGLFDNPDDASDEDSETNDSEDDDYQDEYEPDTKDEEPSQSKPASKDEEEWGQGHGDEEAADEEESPKEVAGDDEEEWGQGHEDETDEEASEWDLDDDEDEESGPKKRKARDTFVDKMDKDELEDWQDFAHHHNSVTRQHDNQTSDSRVNPLKFTEGHTKAAHNKAYKNVREALLDYKATPEYKDMDSADQMMAARKFKKDFRKENPDHRKEAIASYQKAGEVKDKALDQFKSVKDAKIDHILSGASAPGQTMTDQEAAQNLGNVGDGGEAASSNARGTAAGSFAAANPAFIEQEKKTRGIKGVNEESEDLSNPMENPERELHRHESLTGKHYGKIDKLHSEYGGLVNKGVKVALSNMEAQGIDPSTVDRESLQNKAEAGLVHALKTFKKDRTARFSTHVMHTISSLIRADFQTKDEVPKEYRAKVKAFNEKNADPSLGGDSPDKPEQPSAPPVIQPKGTTNVDDFIAQGGTVTKAPAKESKPRSLDMVSSSVLSDYNPKMADTLKRTKAAVVRRKKGGGDAT